jgi:hypothetical protein
MGFMDSVFGEKDEQKTRMAPQTKEATWARKKIKEIAEGPMPDVPLRGVADVQPLGEERTLARDTAKSMAQPQDIFSLPEVQGIIQKTMEEGNLMANRLGRALQSSGSFVTTSGRDVMGRAVSSVQGNLAAALAPFASQERDRRMQTIPLLEALGGGREQEVRSTEQAKLDAIFGKETTEAGQVQSFLLPILQMLISNEPGYVQQNVQGDMGLLEQFGAIAGAFN